MGGKCNTIVSGGVICLYFNLTYNLTFHFSENLQISCKLMFFNEFALFSKFCIFQYVSGLSLFLHIFWHCYIR